MQKLSDTYKYCPECSTSLEAKEAHKKCVKCKRDHFINPSPTAGCIVINSDGEYLLLKRAVEPFMGWWDLPGGFVEEGETLEKAVIREVKEETDLDVKDLEYIESGNGPYEYQGVIRSVVGAMFVAHVDAGAKVKAGDDANDYKFFTKDDIPIDEIAFDAQRELLKRYLAKH